MTCDLWRGLGGGGGGGALLRACGESTGEPPPPLQLPPPPALPSFHSMQDIVWIVFNQVFSSTCAWGQKLCGVKRIFIVYNNYRCVHFHNWVWESRVKVFFDYKTVVFCVTV